MNEHDFLLAAKSGDIASVSSLLADDANLLDLRDETGATAVHYAALSGHREILRFLVDKGADLNCRDREFGATPAGWAIEYIRELGGFLAIEIDDLLYAIHHRDIRWVARFLERFPLLKSQTDQHGTLLREHALKSGDQEILKLFDLVGLANPERVD